jgi:hypothetical protein
LNHKKTPESKKSCKKMHRERKKRTTEKLSPSKFLSKVDNIFEKSETDSNKRTHHSWVGIHERLKPLPYFFIKRRLKCFWEKSKQCLIIWSEIEYPIYTDRYPEWHKWEISPTPPDIWEPAEKK